MIGERPMCAACAHFKNDPTIPGLCCKAYPYGIPDEIVVNGFDHRKPFPGDNGMRFEPSRVTRK